MAAKIFGRYKRAYWERVVRLMWKVHLTGARALKFKIKLADYACPMCHGDIDDFKHIFDTCMDVGITDIRKQYDVKLASFFCGVHCERQIQTIDCLSHKKCEREVGKGEIDLVVRYV
jgi:hypothetical protein